ncbi:hypothetical protein [Sulfitobacter geojensis]|uniref:hypothetical protein n=1 Tax=Sulfitobacter geojensis TaxID=1342299 RepID=UPI003B8BEF98
MTALALSSVTSKPSTAAENSIDNSRFNAGSTAPAGDMMAGDGVEMFTCSILGSGSSIIDGDQTHMFTCSI